MNIEREIIKIEESKWANRHILLVEKNEVIEAFHHGVISNIVYKKLIVDIDKRFLELEYHNQSQ